MLHRRAFLIVAAAAYNPWPGLAGEKRSMFESAIDWFLQIAEKLPNIAESFYQGLLRSKVAYRTLTDSRAALNEIRRKLSDPSSESGLKSKLGIWLKRNEEINNEVARKGESKEEFVARQRREFDVLASDWEAIKKDAVSALHDIERLHDEIESVDPATLNSNEYRAFKSLLQEKQEEAALLAIDTPREPYIIKRLYGVADALDKTIQNIVKNAPALDAAIKKAG